MPFTTIVVKDILLQALDQVVFAINYKIHYYTRMSFFKKDIIWKDLQGWFQQYCSCYLEQQFISASVIYCTIYYRKHVHMSHFNIPLRNSLNLPELKQS